MTIFKSKQKKSDGDLKIKLSGVKIDTNLSWKYHVNDLSTKLNRAKLSFSKSEKMLVVKC